MYFGPSISVGRRGVSYGDSDAQAFIAATGLTGTTEVNAVNNLVANLKSYGLWSKMKAIYPFVSDTVNLLSYSQDYANAYWSKNTTITSNATTAPDGTNTGVQTSGAGNIYTLSPTLTAQQYSVSVYAKANTATSFELNIVTAGFGLGFKCAFNLSTGTAGAVTNYGGLTGTATITNAGNGWYRCTLSGVLTAAQYYYQLTTNANALYIWGSQLEQASSASTYQPIATTPANRFVSQFKYNLKDARDLDAAFRLAFNGTWTYSKQGATPNGVNGYANTYLNASTNIALNSMHFSNYLPNFTPETKCQIGAYNPTGVLGTYAFYNYPTLGALIRLNSSNNVFANPTLTAQGFYLSTRTGATASKLYVNKATIESSSFPSDTAPAFNIYIGARNEAGTANAFSSLRQSFSTIGDGLTDTEATNLYTSVQLFQQELSRYVGVPIVSDANAQAFLDAAVITDQTQANAVNTLVTDLKTYGLWTKMKAIYPFVGGTATTHKWNLKDPRDLDAAYRLAFSGAWTHSSTGALPNGANAYADSFLTPSGNLTASNTAVSYYSRTNTTSNAGVELGSWSSGYNFGIELTLYRSVASNKTAAIINSGGGTAQISGGSVTPTTGLLVGSRLANNNAFVSKNGVTIGTNTTTVTNTLNTFKLYIGASNDFGTAGAYSNKETAFAHIGDGLTETEATNLYTAVNKFQTSLSRNV